MFYKSSKRSFVCTVASVATVIAGLGTAPVIAAESDADELEEVMVIGTRRAAGSASDTPAPVDIITGADFTRAAGSTFKIYFVRLYLLITSTHSQLVTQQQYLVLLTYAACRQTTLWFW